MGYIKRFVRLFGGIFSIALGSVITIQGNVGCNPWIALNTGLNHTFGISVGTASILIGCIFVGVSAILREKIGVGTLINMLFAGIFTDVITYLKIIPRSPNLWVGMIMLVIGCWVFMWGTYLYISAGFGAAPRDCMMVVIARKTKLPVGACRIFLEGVAALSGWLLGGMIGIGTLIAVLINGPILQLICHWSHFNPKTVTHETIPQTFVAFHKMLKVQK